jgi:putative transposase
MRDPQIMLRQKIKDYAQTYVRFGYQRIHILLEREGIHVNHKRVYRLYRLENLHLRKKSTRKRVSRPRVIPPDVSRINESWAMDFVSDQLFDGRRFRALTLIDIYTRECLAIHVAQSIVITGAKLQEITGLKLQTPA